MEPSSGKPRAARPAGAFSQRDLTRAVKGARAAGMQVAEVVLLPSGEIRLRNKTVEAGENRPNDFDREFG